MTTNKIGDTLRKLLFLRPLDTTPWELMEAQNAARDAIAQARTDEVGAVIRSWQSDPAPTSPTEMPSERLLDTWRQIFCDVNKSSGCEIPAHRTMAHLAIQWARSAAGEASEPKKIKEALKDFLGLNPFTATIKQFREAQDAARDAIAQAEADETPDPSQDPALELGEVRTDAKGETILIKDYSGDTNMLHHYNRSPVINFIRGGEVISLDRHQVQALIVTLQRWLNTGSFKFSAPSQEPTP